jgi:hypothetical protein
LGVLPVGIGKEIVALLDTYELDYTRQMECNGKRYIEGKKGTHRNQIKID